MEVDAYAGIGLMAAKPGRRPVDPNDISVYVGVTLPSKQFDKFSRLALRHDVSVPEIIRRQLQEKKTKNTST